MKYVRVSLPGGTVRSYYVNTVRYDDHAVVDHARDQNDLRRKLAILRKHGVSDYDLSILKGGWDGNGYTLTAYVRNNSGYASFLGGILFAVNKRRSKSRKFARR